MGESEVRKAEHGSTGHSDACSKLAALLSQHQTEIARAWAEMVKAVPGAVYGSLPPEEVHSLTARGVAAIAESLEGGSHSVLEEYLVHICPVGSEAIPDASTATEALLLCKDAALPVIGEACGPDSGEAWASISALDERLRWMVGRVTSMCAAEMARQLQAQRAQVAMLLDIAQAASSTLELDQVVSRVADRITTALGVDRCMFYLVDEEQRCAVHISQPSDWSSRVSRSFEDYSSLFHEVLTRRAPVAVYDARSDPRIPPDYMHRDPETKSAVLVPLLVNGKVVAMAGAYTVHDYRHFSDAEIALAQGVGNVLGLVIQNARLYERSKLLAVLEERGRLAREIHDGIAQTLGALQLKASQLEDSFPSQHIDEPRHHLTELQDMISRAYRDLREAMFGLRAVVEPGTDLATALRGYLAQYQAQYGLEVGLEGDEDEPAIVDGETQAQVMRIVQEALRNVLRHAGTGRATVRVERYDDSLRICIMDEGQGFEPGFLEEREDGRHLGLRTMRERAESVGGTLSVDSKPGQGTRVVLQLPILGDRGAA
jgi:nitrate/nitrite-specific signal transduction histidine kinase